MASKFYTPAVGTPYAAIGGQPQLTIRQRAWTNLVSLVANEALARGHITAAEPPKGAGCSEEIHFAMTVCGIPSTASIQDIGFGELRVAVIVGGSESKRLLVSGSLIENSCTRRKIGAKATASAYIERRNGFHIQTHYRGSWIALPLSCEAAFLWDLARMRVEPLGFAASGRFYR